jgi:aldehyde dehydrogenase (NAD+)
MRAAAGTMKRVTLELGGKSPNLVFEDADLTAAVNGSVFAVFYSSGQSCEARTRIYVHEKIHDAFVADFVAKTQKLVVGDPLHEKTQIGALISKSHLAKVHGYVESGRKDGATVACGGKAVVDGDLAKGNFYAPTVLTGVTQKMTVAREEIFGPVVTIAPFKTEAEALELANDTEYGLAGTVWTTNGARAIRASAGIKAGLITVNQPFTGFPGVPFGGYKQSGFGRELALDTLKLYTEQKSVVQWVGEKPLNPFGL